MSKFLTFALGCAPLLAGCYTYVPIAPGAVPQSGEPVALDITDAGRVSLGQRFGPGLTRLEGLLTNVTPDYALNVSRLNFSNAPASHWSGEPVRIDRSLVDRVWQRKLSRRRTAATVGIVAVAMTAVFIAADLVGAFEGPSSSPNEPPGPISNRVGR